MHNFLELKYQSVAYSLVITSQEGVVWVGDKLDVDFSSMSIKDDCELNWNALHSCLKYEQAYAIYMHQVMQEF